jgi:hypothetical protein
MYVDGVNNDYLSNVNEDCAHATERSKGPQGKQANDQGQI